MEWSGRDPTKDTLRERMWSLLVERGAAVGDPSGHIPNFIGAQHAAEQLTRMPGWAEAQVVKCNPDAAQAPLRELALAQGKTVYMAVPRLRDERCFVALSAAQVRAQGATLQDAAQTQTALKLGQLLAFSQMAPIDLVVVGCVAVARNGGRTGKGAGFADIELGLLRHFKRVGPHTPIVTTVHALQIVTDDAITMRPHDSALDWIATPDALIETHTPYPQPTGILWDSLRADQWEAIPVLGVVKEVL